MIEENLSQKYLLPKNLPKILNLSSHSNLYDNKLVSIIKEINFALIPLGYYTILKVYKLRDCFINERSHLEKYKSKFAKRDLHYRSKTQENNSNNNYENFRNNDSINYPITSNSSYTLRNNNNSINYPSTSRSDLPNWTVKSKHDVNLYNNSSKFDSDYDTQSEFSKLDSDYDTQSKFSYDGTNNSDQPQSRQHSITRPLHLYLSCYQIIRLGYSSSLLDILSFAGPSCIENISTIQIHQAREKKYGIREYVSRVCGLQFFKWTYEAQRKEVTSIDELYDLIHAITGVPSYVVDDDANDSYVKFIDQYLVDDLISSNMSIRGGRKVRWITELFSHQLKTQYSKQARDAVLDDIDRDSNNNGYESAHELFQLSKIIFETNFQHL